MIRLGVLAGMLIGAAVLTGCADPSGSQSSLLHRTGLTAGPLPAPKPFVVQSRPTSPQPYPGIYADPPARSDALLQPTEQQQLEASLSAKAQSPPPLTRRKKPLVNQRISPLF